MALDQGEQAAARDLLEASRALEAASDAGGPAPDRAAVAGTVAALLERLAQARKGAQTQPGSGPAGQAVSLEQAVVNALA
jgi:hypothetical protein